VEVNIEPAFAAADFFIAEKAGTALARIVDEIKKIES
jgi:hypothetical protein